MYHTVERGVRLLHKAIATHAAVYIGFSLRCKACTCTKAVKSSRRAATGSIESRQRVLFGSKAFVKHGISALQERHGTESYMPFGNYSWRLHLQLQADQCHHDLENYDACRVLCGAACRGTHPKPVFKVTGVALQPYEAIGCTPTTNAAQQVLLHHIMALFHVTCCLC